MDENINSLLFLLFLYFLLLIYVIHVVVFVIIWYVGVIVIIVVVNEVMNSFFFVVPLVQMVVVVIVDVITDNCYVDALVSYTLSYYSLHLLLNVVILLDNIVAVFVCRSCTKWTRVYFSYPIPIFIVRLCTCTNIFFNSFLQQNLDFISILSAILKSYVRKNFSLVLT